MKQKQTFSDKVFRFDQELGNVKINVPEPYKIINPYSGRNKKQVLKWPPNLRAIFMAKLSKRDKIETYQLW